MISPRTVIALDTATPATVAALCGGPGSKHPGEPVRERVHVPRPGERPGHAAQALPMLAELLAEAGLRFADVDLVAIGTGPGTFTGLRIGVAVARGLALALEAPLIGVSTLESLALGVAGAAAVLDGQSSRPVLASVDARRGEVFAAAWATGGGELLECLLEPAPLGPRALAAAVAALPAPPICAGPGALLFAAAMESAGAEIPPGDSPLHGVSAALHCRLALARPAGDAERVLPSYLREPDAEPSRRRRDNATR